MQVKELGDGVGGLGGIVGGDTLHHGPMVGRPTFKEVVHEVVHEVVVDVLGGDDVRARCVTRLR